MNVAVIEQGHYLSEAEVLDRWPMLTAKELRKARRLKNIRFYAFRGGPCYTAEQVQDYIDLIYLRDRECNNQKPMANEALARLAQIPLEPMSRLSLEASTSVAPTLNGEDSSMPAGMTPELAASAAELLKQRIGRKPKSRSRPSSSPRQPQPGQKYPALIKS